MAPMAGPGGDGGATPCSGALMKQGAEARLYHATFCGRPAVVKERFRKTYRHPQLDDQITAERIRAEARALARCRKLGVHTPAVYHVDLAGRRLVMEHIAGGATVRDVIARVSSIDGAVCPQLLRLAANIGRMLAKLHANGLVHGDLTTSNMLVRDDDVDRLTLIDFGLSGGGAGTGTGAGMAEEIAVDLYVLERAILSTHPNSGAITEAIYTAYKEAWPDAEAVMTKLFEVRMRGRKRLMLG